MWTNKSDVLGENENFSEVLVLLQLNFFLFQLVEHHYIRLSVKVS